MKQYINIKEMDTLIYILENQINIYKDKYKYLKIPQYKTKSKEIKKLLHKLFKNYKNVYVLNKRELKKLYANRRRK